MVQKYFRGAFEAGLNIFEIVQQELESLNFTDEESRHLKKLLKIFFLGQLIGLPTLHSILSQYDITSNKHQIDYVKLCNKLTHNELHK